MVHLVFSSQVVPCAVFALLKWGHDKTKKQCPAFRREKTVHVLTGQKNASFLKSYSLFSLSLSFFLFFFFFFFFFFLFSFLKCFLCSTLKEVRRPVQNALSRRQSLICGIFPVVIFLKVIGSAIRCLESGADVTLQTKAGHWLRTCHVARCRSLPVGAI